MGEDRIAVDFHGELTRAARVFRRELTHVRTSPLGHCGGDCNSRSRLGKAWQIISANVSVFDEMTDDEQKTMLAALEALRDA
jgi:hypothetical protein